MNSMNLGASFNNNSPQVRQERVNSLQTDQSNFSPESKAKIAAEARKAAKIARLKAFAEKKEKEKLAIHLKEEQKAKKKAMKEQLEKMALGIPPFSISLHPRLTNAFYRYKEKLPERSDEVKGKNIA